MCLFFQPPAANVAPSLDTSDMDPELARYLNRNYWQGKADDSHKTGGGGSGGSGVSTTQPSAPMTSQNASQDRADEVGLRACV